ncbi:MAG: hypothetical protein ACO3VS_04185 [Limisphaerales bacterium]
MKKTTMWIVCALGLIGLSPSGLSVDAAENQNGKRPSGEQVRSKSKRDDRLQTPSPQRNKGVAQGNRQDVRDQGNRQNVRDRGNRQDVRDQGNRRNVRDQGNRQDVRDQGNRQNVRDRGNRQDVRENDQPLEETRGMGMGPRGMGMGPRGMGMGPRGMNQSDAEEDSEVQERPRRRDVKPNEGSRGRENPDAIERGEGDERRSESRPQRGRRDEGEASSRDREETTEKETSV